MGRVGGALEEIRILHSQKVQKFVAILCAMFANARIVDFYIPRTLKFGRIQSFVMISNRENAIGVYLKDKFDYTI